MRAFQPQLKTRPTIVFVNRGWKPLQQEDGTRRVPTTLHRGWKPLQQWKSAVGNRSNNGLIPPSPHHPNPVIIYSINKISHNL